MRTLFVKAQEVIARARDQGGSEEESELKGGGEEKERRKKARLSRIILSRVTHFVTPRWPHVVQRARLSARLSPIVVANIGRQARARVW